MGTFPDGNFSGICISGIALCDLIGSVSVILTFYVCFEVKIRNFWSILVD